MKENDMTRNVEAVKELQDALNAEIEGILNALSASGGLREAVIENRKRIGRLSSFSIRWYLEEINQGICRHEGREHWLWNTPPDYKCCGHCSKWLPRDFLTTEHTEKNGKIEVKK